MSLKDRLNTQGKIPHKPDKQDEVQKHKTFDDVLEVDSLGILETILGDDDLNSIYVSGAKNVYVQRKGKTVKSTSVFRDSVQLENMLNRVAQNLGITLNEKVPVFKYNQKLGINVSAMLPPLSVPASIYIKCYCDKHASLQRLQEVQSISKEMALVLEGLVSIKKNIIIIGAKSAQKTTLLSALAKKLPLNLKGVLIDFSQEVQIHASNFTNYDFSQIDDLNLRNAISDTIFNSGQDKVFINDPDKNTIAKIVEASRTDNKGFILTLDAKNNKNALRKLALAYMSDNPNIGFDEALSAIYDAFDVIITTRLDSNGKRKVDSVSEIDEEEYSLSDIFTFTHLNEHSSSGIIPKFYEDFKEYSLPVSVNIFDIEYKHTYYKNYSDDVLSHFSKKSANAEILKKFKKELPTEDSNIEEQNEKQDDIQTGHSEKDDSPIEQNNNEISDLEVNEENNNEIQPEENINLEDDKNV